MKINEMTIECAMCGYSSKKDPSLENHIVPGGCEDHLFGLNISLRKSNRRLLGAIKDKDDTIEQLREALKAAMCCGSCEHYTNDNGYECCLNNDPRYLAGDWDHGCDPCDKYETRGQNDKTD